MADYRARMDSFVERWAKKYPARHGELMLEAVAEFPPDTDMPATIREAAIATAVAAKVRLEAGAPDYEQWVVIQRERASAGGK